MDVAPFMVKEKMRQTLLPTTTMAKIFLTHSCTLTTYTSTTENERMKHVEHININVQPLSCASVVLLKKILHMEQFFFLDLCASGTACLFDRTI